MLQLEKIIVLIKTHNFYLKFANQWFTNKEETNKCKDAAVTNLKMELNHQKNV